MARWKLKASHYLNVPKGTTGSEWEHKETSQTTGRQTRVVFHVPRLFDLQDPGDYNAPDGIIVCHEGKGDPRDHIFFGPPTPDMEPLDAEARAISKDESPKWAKPVERIDGSVDYSSQLIAAFEKQMTEVTARAVPNTAVSRSEIDELKATIKRLEAKLGAKAA